MDHPIFGRKTGCRDFKIEGTRNERRVSAAKTDAIVRVRFTGGRPMSTTYQFFKDFAGPIATIIASGAALFVTTKLGLNQVGIAREQAKFAKANSRSAQQKLILDLFDKRWSIVTELREVIGEVLRTGNVSHEAKVKFYLAADRAAFLFGPEVKAYLAKIQASLLKHHAAQADIDSVIDKRRGKAADIQYREFEVIQGFYTSFDPLIAPYMQMHDKVPS
jgi:hypothetical protein